MSNKLKGREKRQPVKSPKEKRAEKKEKAMTGTVKSRKPRKTGS